MVIKYVVTQALKAGVKKAPKKSNCKTIWQPVKEIDKKTLLEVQDIPFL